MRNIFLLKLEVNYKSQLNDLELINFACTTRRHIKLTDYPRLLFTLTKADKEVLLFIKAKSRDTVLVGEDEIYKVLSFVGGARDPLAPTNFQMANVD